MLSVRKVYDAGVGLVAIMAIAFTLFLETRLLPTAIAECTECCNVCGTAPDWSGDANQPDGYASSRGEDDVFPYGVGTLFSGSSE